MGGALAAEPDALPADRKLAYFCQGLLPGEAAPAHLATGAPSESLSVHLPATQKPKTLSRTELTREPVAGH